MESLEAVVIEEAGEHVIRIERPPDSIVIPLSRNDANAVKEAFNKLLQVVQLGQVSILLKDVREDLFSQVAQEYLKQLNEELKEIRKEMERKGLAAK